MVADTLICNSKHSVEFFLFVVQNSERVILKGKQVRVEENIGAEGWANMALACVHLGVRIFRASRECMLEGERGDLKAIWDALANMGMWLVCDVLIDGTLTGHPGDYHHTMDVKWNTEEEKERAWRELQVGIKLFNVKCSSLISYGHCVVQEILDKPSDQWSAGLKQEWHLVAENDV